MYVRGVVDGHDEQAKARVSVQPDLVRLQANRSAVKPGEEVKFTASTENGTSFTVQSWKWAGSSPPAQGQALTSAAGCGTQDECTIKVYEAGTMTVTALVSGASETQDASASMSVIPCDTTGDPRLDDPSMRKKMFDAVDDSKSANHELGGPLYVNPGTGEHLIILVPSAGNDPCAWQPGNPVPSSEIPPGFVPDTADFHTHPLAKGDPIPAACHPPGFKNVSGATAGDGPSECWLSNGTVDCDWYFEAIRGHAGYLADADGHIHRWNHPDDGSLTHSTMWKRDGDSSCLVLVQ